MQRREFLAGAATAAVLGTPARSDDAGVIFGLTPVFLTNDQALLTLIRGYLQEGIGTRVELVQRRTYQEITAMLLAGQIDAASICGYPYVRHRVEFALVAVRVWHGQPLYRSYLIGRRTVRGRRSPTFAVTFTPSQIRIELRLPGHDGGAGRDGHQPEAFFARSFFTYGHRNVVRAVGSGLAQSGSVDGYVWEALTVAEPALPAATRVIARSEWLASRRSPACATCRQPADPRARRRADQMPESPSGRAVLALLQLDGSGCQVGTLRRDRRPRPKGGRTRVRTLRRVRWLPLTVRVPLLVVVLMLVLGAIASERVLSKLADLQERQLRNWPRCISTACRSGSCRRHCATTSGRLSTLWTARPTRSAACRPG